MRTLALNRGVLRNLPLFSVLTEPQLDTLMMSMQFRSYPRHALIVRADESSDALYIVVSGRARVVVDDGEGREMIVCDVGPNEFFGELSLIDGRPRSATVQALEPCQALCVCRKAVVRCLEENVHAAMLMLNTVIKRLRQADAKIADLAFTDVSARVAREMLERAQDVKGEWVVEPGTEQIARMVAASREMVSRVLKRLQQGGVIRRHKRKIILVNRTALTERAGARR
jgi:CRP/FNR family transcriptional regulator, cyclic AMP receptor protein